MFQTTNQIVTSILSEIQQKNDSSNGNIKPSRKYVQYGFAIAAVV